jgi:hypothetical protein
MISPGTRRWRRLVIVALVVLLPPASSRSQVANPPAKPFSPVKAPPNAQYVGTKTCALCHDQHAAGQQANAMARALETVAESEVLRRHPAMSLKLGPYSYSIERKGDASIYTVTDGRETISEPIAWVFGKSVMGQTYVIRHNGRLYESRVSFYNEAYPN